MAFIKCPRCGDHALEKLATHDHCINCNFSTVTFARDWNLGVTRKVHKMIERSEFLRLLMKASMQGLSERETERLEELSTLPHWAIEYLKTVKPKSMNRAMKEITHELALVGAV